VGEIFTQENLVMRERLNFKRAATAAAIMLTFGAAALAKAETKATGDASVKIERFTSRHHRGPASIREHRQHGTFSSSNWSGFSVTSGKGEVNSASGAWIVPAATCGTAENDTSGYASFWVGIDGFSSNTVEQIGTDSDCVSLNGRTTSDPTYYAWFEFYPA